MSEQERPTGEQIAAAGRLVGLEFTEDECKQMRSVWPRGPTTWKAARRPLRSPGQP